jgi:hypothetical protein
MTSTSWRRFTIRSHLVVLVLATLLPVLVFTGFMLLEYVKLQQVELNRGMTDTARALSLAVDREIGRVRAVVETLATSTYLDSKDFERFYEASSRAAKTIEGSWIVLFDRSGQQITNTLRPFGAGLPNTLYEATPAETADSLPRGAPESIRQVVATGKPVVSDLFIGIVSKRPSISIKRS